MKDEKERLLQNLNKEFYQYLTLPISTAEEVKAISDFKKSSVKLVSSQKHKTSAYIVTKFHKRISRITSE